MSIGRAPIAVALDGPDLATVTAWAAAAGPHVTTMKVGLETYLRDGAAAIDGVREVTDCDLFLDLKLHDIPHTVAGAARSIARFQPDYLTVHASGGAAMIRAAAETLPDTLVTGVTVLTSLTAADVADIGFAASPEDTVRRLARLAVEAGARALVCSPQEVALVRAEVGPTVRLITPGVRPLGAAAGDQARVATPEDAVAAGADLVVVGRPITAAASVGAAAQSLAEALLASIPNPTLPNRDANS